MTKKMTTVTGERKGEGGRRGEKSAIHSKGSRARFQPFNLTIIMLKRQQIVDIVNITTVPNDGLASRRGGGGAAWSSGRRSTRGLKSSRVDGCGMARRGPSLSFSLSLSLCMHVHGSLTVT